MLKQRRIHVVRKKSSKCIGGYRMATRPSGFGEEVKLVKIEAVDLSLILKGKLYHERYEGLNQYRYMDFHDTMEFVDKVENIQTVKVYDINENELVVQKTALRPILYENGV